MTGATSGPAIGIDIGGTKILGAVIDSHGTVLEEHRVPSPGGWNEIRASVTEVVAQLRQRFPSVVAVGVGAAGMVTMEGTIQYSPNVLGFRSAPVRSELESAFGLPVTVDNDANVAAYAEHRLGAARGATDAMVITLGTGIGGGIIVGGKMLRGAHGFAGEVGHFQIDPDGPMCACGERGHWEALASGSALGRMGRAAVASGDAPNILAAADGDSDAIEGRHVSKAARAGASDALTLIDHFCENVATGLVALANIFDPTVIAIAGGLVNDKELFIDPIRVHFVGHIEGADYRPIPAVVAAELGENAGVIGAAIMALDACN